MAGSPRTRHRHIWAAGPLGALVLLAVVTTDAAQPPADPPLDAMQQAVVSSLAADRRTTPAAFLDAAIRAADVEATAVSLEWFGRLVDAIEDAGGDRLGILADLGDSVDQAALGRLERLLRPREPAVGKVVAAIREASRLRRRDPKTLARAVEGLRAPTVAAREAAALELARAREDALPVLVPLLQSTAASDKQPRGLARELVALLGDDARQPLLDWLASEDVDSWPGVIEALDASGAEDIESFLLAPALVPDVPQAAREAALDVLARRSAARGGDSAAPDRNAAQHVLAERLDRTLSPAGLPTVDHMLLEPVTDPNAAAAAFGGGVTGVVERLVWNPQARRFDRVRMSPRAARARDALHVARDLAALDTRDTRGVNLVLLARVEALVERAGDASGLAPKELQTVLAGPDGFTPESAADVLDAAGAHGMWEAAAGVAAALAPARGEQAVKPLPPAARKALVRALAVPNADLQFAAARSLALAAGDPPYAGSSRVLDVLLHAATATGSDRVVIAHPDVEVVDALATGVSRFGYEPVRVATGREAIFAARSSADTVLVLLGARIATPSAFETTQFLQRQGLGDVPPVLVVVDPLDDDGRGCFLSQLLMKFCDLDRVGIIDRLDSVFLPTVDETTGGVVTLPRFPDVLAQVAGPAAVDPASRDRARVARLGRAHEAFALLSRLSRRGWDTRAATETALMALLTEELYGPSVSLLATLPRPEAQAALAAEAERADLPAALRSTALAAFAASVERHGVLLDCGQVRGVARRYTRGEGASQDAPGAILEVLEQADRRNHAALPDAAHTRPTR
jgi:hypothetical protein